MEPVTVAKGRKRRDLETVVIRKVIFLVLDIGLCPVYDLQLSLVRDGNDLSHMTDDLIIKNKDRSPVLLGQVKGPDRL